MSRDIGFSPGGSIIVKLDALPCPTATIPPKAGQKRPHMSSLLTLSYSNTDRMGQDHFELPFHHMPRQPIDNYLHGDMLQALKGSVTRLAVISDQTGQTNLATDRHQTLHFRGPYGAESDRELLYCGSRISDAFQIESRRHQGDDGRYLYHLLLNSQRITGRPSNYPQRSDIQSQANTSAGFDSNNSNGNSIRPVLELGDYWRSVLERAGLPRRPPDAVERSQVQLPPKDISAECKNYISHQQPEERQAEEASLQVESRSASLDSFMEKTSDSRLAGSSELADQPTEKKKKRSRGRTCSFPQKLHLMLTEMEKQGTTNIASFVADGKAFAIHNPQEFTQHTMSKYFKMNSYDSFQRQLNLYDFVRIRKGPNRGAYCHELFIQNKPLLSISMTRTKVKGTAASSLSFTKK